MMLNKILIQWFRVDVTKKALLKHSVDEKMDEFIFTLSTLIEILCLVRKCFSNGCDEKGCLPSTGKNAAININCWHWENNFFNSKVMYFFNFSKFWVFEVLLVVEINFLMLKQLFPSFLILSDAESVNSPLEPQPPIVYCPLPKTQKFENLKI